MLSLKTNHLERVEALSSAFDRVATRLLADLEPDDEAIGLLILVTTDAALSGDRTILAGIREALDRLQSYLESTTSWADEFRGRLWTLKQLVDLSNFLLDQEVQIARHVEPMPGEAA